MRTQGRDQGGMTTFGASVAGQSAAGGSGVAQPGAIPFVFTRTTAGTYEIRFDTRLTPVFTTVTAGNGTYFATNVPLASGYMLVQTYTAPGTLANGDFRFSITAVDKRS